MTEISSDDRLEKPVTEADHAAGPSDAPLTLVEYGDFECPDCENAFPVVKELQRRLGDKLRLVYRHFPQNSIHPHASAAANAAEAAAAQGKFWEMHDLLFKNRAHLADADFVHYALKLGLEPYRFEADIGAERFTKKVRGDLVSGQFAGVRGTPTFFINGKRYRGEISVEGLMEELGEA